MKISMSPTARYVTRQSLFDNQIFGILTDRQIERYRLMGKYDPVAPNAVGGKHHRRKQTNRRQRLLNELLG